MSWRGTKGAVEAAKQQHNVILTPGSHCYFDHYQSDSENEPLAIGGFLPLEKVYSFNPIPEELTKEESKYVLGAQGNVWTEYMQTAEKVEYMVFPRAIALAEVVWSSKKNKNYKNFVDRLESFQKRLEVMNVNYANHLHEIKGELVNENGRLTCKLETTTGKKIIYSLDGTQPCYLLGFEYKKPIKINTDTSIKAAIFNTSKKQLGLIFEQKIKVHKAVGKQISLNVAPDKAYNAGGKKALINGISGSDKRYGDKEWLGFSGEDLEITINFDSPTEINNISTRFYNGNGQWIYAPKTVNIKLKLENGKTISSKNSLKNTGNLLVNFNLNIAQWYPKNEILKSTQLKITIPNYGIIEEGRQGSGHKAWTFIDEIIIE
jgi:hexosaminidase